MIEETRVCAKDDCDVVFKPKSHNQCYCSKAHQKIETNRKIMVKYYEKKSRLKGDTRICNVCNTTELSQYNPSLICRSCEVKARELRDQKALDELGKFLV